MELHKNKTQKEAIDALDRMLNYCEEIDYHIEPEERTGYKMFPDYQIVSDVLHKLDTKAIRAAAIEEFAERLTKYYNSLKGKIVTDSIIYFINVIAEELKEKDNEQKKAD